MGILSILRFFFNLIFSCDFYGYCRPMVYFMQKILYYFLENLHYRGNILSMMSNCHYGFDQTVLSYYIQFLARDSMLSALYAIARPSVRLSVCPSVPRVDQSKTVEHIIEILSPPDRPNILVFRHQTSLRKSDGFTPNGGAKYKG